MKKRLCTLLLVGLAGIAATSRAQNSELRIGGVIRPTACTPELTGGTTVDLGTLKPVGVDDEQGEPLERELSIVITCDAPTRVGIKPQDNRPDTIPHQLVRPRPRQVVAGNGKDDLFGLGTSGRTKLGGYEVSFVPGSFLADGVQVDTIASRQNSQGGTPEWVRRDAGQMRSGVVNAWAPAGKLAPGAYSNIRGMLRVRAMLAPNSELHVVDQMQLDGSITFEVQYL